MTGSKPQRNLPRVDNAPRVFLPKIIGKVLMDTALPWLMARIGWQGERVKVIEKFFVGK